jgi:hypothetical protein
MQPAVVVSEIGPGSSRKRGKSLSAKRGDLNPTALVKILKIFASPTAKNRHLPP